MSTTEAATRGEAQASPSVRSGWRPVQYLALAGVLLAILEVWTWASWLASGPRPITRWRDPGDPS